MAATIASMAMFNAKSLNITPPPSHTSKPSPILKPISLLSLQNLPKGLAIFKSPLTSTAVAGAIFSALSYTDTAFAAQQIADIAEGDNRGLALLIPLIPAILWVLYNILQPALNQLDRMNSEKGFIVGLGLGGGLAAAGFMAPGNASADELAAIADASSSSDSRGLLLLFVVVPAILWVLYNILQPALNQLDRMKSG
ncbi:photosystem II core complex proteins psbY, chloroplastic [Dioscorea cayenensis subsp. rotundata]|uniref:Photosystem II core complex proteins psbY, chloroplastic n=1 Tax=Dioscorea cayennensis subsp. rotundata TaxID=55577 RepID=A0AB40B9E3_DIOCR|nr:photosystem II core complex proteins psbY, chloroplastic [Dioscorea cayenensis subsp. rotundata]